MDKLKDLLEFTTFEITVMDTEGESRRRSYSFRWLGRPWQRVRITRELIEDGLLLDAVPWPLVKVRWDIWDDTYIYVRRDVARGAVALAWLLWYRAGYPAYMWIARRAFCLARRLGYGYCREGVAARWRDLFARRPARMT